MGTNIDLSKFAPIIKIPKRIARRGGAPKTEYLFQINGSPFIGRRQTQSLSGKTGHGKSTFGLCLLAACACGKFGPIETTKGGHIKALWIDTEQGISLLIERYEQVLKMAAIEGLDDKDIRYERLRAISLAEYDTIKEMKQAIEEDVSTMQPDFIFLDGVADLVEDFNDISEARKIVKWVKDLSFNNNCAVMSMIHQNKNANNAKGDKLGGIQGNLGSILARKAYDSFVVETVEKTNGLRTILHEKARTYKVLDPLYMTAEIDEGALEITLSTVKPLIQQMNEIEQEETRKAILIEAIRSVEKPNITNIRGYLHEKYKYSHAKTSILVKEGKDKGWAKEEGKLYRVIGDPEEPQPEPEKDNKPEKTKRKPRKKKEDPL